MSDQIGLYFVGEATADQRADPENPRKMLVALGGSMYFGSMGAANAIRDMDLKNAKSFFVGPISEDYYGHLIRDDFEKSGVETSYVRVSSFISKIAVISEDGQGGNKYSFYTRSQGGTDTLRIEQLPSSFAETKRIFTFGSVTTTLSANGQVLREFAKLQSQKGSIVLFDPNTRPSAIPDVNVYRSALEEWIRTSSIVKASEEDIEFMYPDKTAKELAQHWLSLGPKAVFITHGGKGCSVHHKDQTADIETTSSPFIRSTIGAGDNFNAGIVIALAQKGITEISQLGDLDNDAWKKIALTANMVAYRHLLRLNQVAEAAD